MSQSHHTDAEVRRKRLEALSLTGRRLETAEDVAAQLDTLVPTSSQSKIGVLPPVYRSTTATVRETPTIGGFSAPKGKPQGKGSSTVSTLLQLYCSIPPCEITGEQLAVFLSIQFGVKVQIPVIRTNQKGNLYCFLYCEKEKDHEKLLKELNYENDVTLPDNTPGSYGDIPGTRDVPGTIWVKPPIEESE